MAIITFDKLTKEEQKISNDFFNLCDKLLPNGDEHSQDKFDQFFCLFVELCHNRIQKTITEDNFNFNPNQLEIEFKED